VNVAVDHLVLAAADLEQGADWCQRKLGATPALGGRHVQFGTHNRLLRVAAAGFAQAYLEIIAIDPAAPVPARPRWFGLDEVALQRRVASEPRLIHFVARTPTLGGVRKRLIDAGLDPGEPVHAWRDSARGRLEWEILVRQDGALLCRGALPTLIEWRGIHPAESMPESGVTLQSLSLCGVPRAVQRALQLEGVTMDSGPGPALLATLATPLGSVTLSSD
jgi:Glyoxalase-like domain